MRVEGDISLCLQVSVDEDGRDGEWEEKVEKDGGREVHGRREGGEGGEKVEKVETLHWRDI